MEIFTLQLRRDDAALAAQLRQLAESVGAATGYTTARTRELLLLTVIRDPIAAEALQMVAGHSDPEVAAAARQALAALPE